MMTEGGGVWIVITLAALGLVVTCLVRMNLGRPPSCVRILLVLSRYKQNLSLVSEHKNALT